MQKFLVVAAAAALLAACSPSSDASKTEAAAAPPAVAPMPQLTTYTHKAWDNVFGYYVPTAPVKAGNFQLIDLHLGIENGFAEWEAGNRTRTYAPVMMQFDDVTSAVRVNALGNKSHSVSIKLTPTGYVVNDGTLQFVGTHPKLGEVRLDAKIDMAALKKAKAAKKDAPPTTVITGNLQVGETAFPNVAFNWTGGDDS